MLNHVSKILIFNDWLRLLQSMPLLGLFHYVQPPSIPATYAKWILLCLLRCFLPYGLNPYVVLLDAQNLALNFHLFPHWFCSESSYIFGAGQITKSYFSLSDSSARSTSFEWQEKLAPPHPRLRRNAKSGFSSFWHIPRIAAPFVTFESSTDSSQYGMSKLFWSVFLNCTFWPLFVRIGDQTQLLKHR